MNSKKKATAANQGSKQKEQSEWLQCLINSCGEDQPQVPLPQSRVYDFRDSNPIDPYILTIWKEREPDWFDEALRTQLRDMLRGLDRRIAREVIECLTNYIVWGSRDFTGLWHIDVMLRKAYNKIAYFVEKHGFDFPEYHSEW